jgi:sugar/nucleoside kinase (ribokinase family)
MRVFARYQAHAEVTLGLNYNEAIQVSEVLGLNPQDEDSSGLRQMAQDIRNELELACVVVHPVSSAACATKEDSWWAPGPFTPNPKITTGAGDHFNAGFCAARLCGFSPKSCLTLASCTSGHYVRTAQSPSSSQVLGFLRELTQES